VAVQEVVPLLFDGEPGCARLDPPTHALMSTTLSDKVLRSLFLSMIHVQQTGMVHSHALVVFKKHKGSRSVWCCVEAQCWEHGVYHALSGVAERPQWDN